MLFQFLLLMWDTEKWLPTATVYSEGDFSRILKRALKQAKRERLGVSFGVLKLPAHASAEQVVDALAALPPPGVAPNHVNTSDVNVNWRDKLAELHHG